MDRRLHELTRTARRDPAQRGRLRRALERAGRDPADAVLATWRARGESMGPRWEGVERVIARRAELLAGPEEALPADFDAALDAELAALPLPVGKPDRPPLWTRAGHSLSPRAMQQVLGVLARQYCSRPSRSWLLLRRRLDDRACDLLAGVLTPGERRAQVLLLSERGLELHCPRPKELAFRGDPAALRALLRLSRGWCPERRTPAHRGDEKARRAARALETLARQRGAGRLEELIEEAVLELGFDARGDRVLHLTGDPRRRSPHDPHRPPAAWVRVHLDEAGRAHPISRRRRRVPSLRHALQGEPVWPLSAYLHTACVALTARAAWARAEAAALLQAARDEGRVWSAARFLRSWATAPLLSRVARGWLFRRAADGLLFTLDLRGPVDAAGRLLTLGEWRAWEAGVRVATRLSPAEQAAWRAVPRPAVPAQAGLLQPAPALVR